MLPDMDKSEHGGRRDGAGRPRLEGIGITRVDVKLLERHINKVERWQEANGCDSFSEALRQMIDAMPSPH